MSYGELWQAAQAIASEMRAHGLKRSDVVAISGPKSFGLIACMVAALLSGGVMLTLDRRFPVERQRLLVRETGAKQILYIGDFKPEDAWIRELDAATIIEIEAGGALPVHPLALRSRCEQLTEDCARRSRLHLLHFGNDRRAQGNFRIA